MEIEIVRAYIVTEGGRKALNKGVAKQFPIRSMDVRSFLLQNEEKVNEPICKVMGRTLGSVASWLYLVRDAEAGYAWEPACTVRSEFKDRYHSDDPSEVQTVIL